MSDDQLRERLNAYADGELDPVARAEVEDLLRRDPRARAEVAWCRSLRTACRRVVEAEPLPDGLESRIRKNLAQHRWITRRRVLRIGVPGLAAAALLLAFWAWPREAAATAIDPDSFATVYERCAVHGRHDTIGVRSLGSKCCASSLRCKAPGGCCVPDISSCGGYRIDGGCTCSPSGVKLLHVYFRSDAAPDVVISAFALNQRIRLVHGCSPGATHCGGSSKPIDPAELKGVSVVLWKSGPPSYVLAARMPESQLRTIANGATLASVQQLLKERGEAVALAPKP